jgi:glycosyltransferase involved in cell wall biosynthesis
MIMLEEYKNREPFTLPDNYFEDFASRMDARLIDEMVVVSSEEAPQSRRIDFRRMVMIVASSAAVFVGLLFGGFALMNIQEQVDAQAEDIIAQETYEDELLELIDIYRANDIFVMPSFTESFGLVYAEAISQGLPVVYSIGQGFDRQFPEGEVGYHADPNSAQSVADAILTYFLHLFCCIFLHVRMPDCLKKRVPDFFLRRPFTIFAKRY